MAEFKYINICYYAERDFKSRNHCNSLESNNAVDITYYLVKSRKKLPYNAKLILALMYRSLSY